MLNELKLYICCPSMHFRLSFEIIKTIFSHNCFTCEWNSMNSANCAKIFWLVVLLVHRPMQNKFPLMHLLDAIIYKYAATPRVTKHAVINITYKTTTYSNETAMKYPSGFFQSNGNLVRNDTFRLRCVCSR